MQAGALLTIYLFLVLNTVPECCTHDCLCPEHGAGDTEVRQWLATQNAPPNFLQDLREGGVQWSSVHELVAEELAELTLVPSAVAYHILSCCRLRREGEPWEQATDFQYQISAATNERARERESDHEMPSARSSSSDAQSLLDLMDNSALPLQLSGAGHGVAGHRLAVIMSGLAKQGVFEHALHALKVNVVDALGPNQVHIFIHTESADVGKGREQAASEVLETIHSHLNESILKGYIITPPDSKKQEERGEWMGVDKRAQYDRLQEAFKLVLNHEQTLETRYAWVCRARTDTLFLSPWNHSALIQLLPQNSTGRNSQKSASYHTHYMN